MHILLIPDSFKGSISSSEYCSLSLQAIQQKFPDTTVSCFPMADGGENTAAVIFEYFGCRSLTLDTVGADKTPLRVDIPVLENHTAFIESAVVVGLHLPQTNACPPSERTTAGLGRLIAQLYAQGYRKVYVGLGGSGTNDGGFGLLQALGVAFTFATPTGQPQPTQIEDMQRITSADFREYRRNFPDLQLFALTDVTNPLLGPEGATAVFGPQKGVDAIRFDRFESAIAALSQAIACALDSDIAAEPGSGAAGGLGFALRSLGADILPGAEYLIKLYDIKAAMADADLVITGEGLSDAQTLFGKLPLRIAKLAQSMNVPCVLISGGISAGDIPALNREFTACFDICTQPMPLEDALKVTQTSLPATVCSVISLFKAGATGAIA